MLDAPPERGLGGENLIPFSESRRRLAFLSRTQTLTKVKVTSKNGALTGNGGATHKNLGGPN